VSYQQAGHLIQSHQPGPTYQPTRQAYESAAPEPDKAYESAAPEPGKASETAEPEPDQASASAGVLPRQLRTVREHGSAVRSMRLRKRLHGSILHGHYGVQPFHELQRARVCTDTGIQLFLQMYSSAGRYDVLRLKLKNLRSEHFFASARDHSELDILCFQSPRVV
jgi:hypothetical protein